MSTTVVVVLITVGLLSLLALGATVLFLLTQLKTLTRALSELQDKVAGPLADLSAAAEVTQRELERVADAAAELGVPQAGDDPARSGEPDTR